MHIETYIVAFVLLIGWIATAFFLIRTNQKAYARGQAKGLIALSGRRALEIEGLRKDLRNQIKLRHAAQTRARNVCTLADHELLTNLDTTLRLAVETWQAFPGTEPMVAKASQQRLELTALTAKMWLPAFLNKLKGEDAA